MSNINDSTDEQIFFECMPSGSDASNILPHIAKQKLIISADLHVQREIMVFTAIH